ncbi:MAG: preprotein translocase subunit YajC [Candidatus Accumulibacter sp.]|nr:preprotein translocase subunit YajC [Accumulibacter sp.]
MFISNAYAQSAIPGVSFLGGGFDQIFIMLAMFGVFYFLMIRPQQKKAKEHKAMLESLAKGDEIITQGGIAGRITKVSDNFVGVAIAENVEIQLQRSAIGAALPRGTLKSL